MPIKQEQDSRKQLTPRQIVNRYRKGDYIDESVEAISSVISSCDKSFDSVAVPIPTTIVEKVLENIGIAKNLYELQKEGKEIDSVLIPDYPQLKDILTDLSYPKLWESMQILGEISADYADIIKEKGFWGKYLLDVKPASTISVTGYVAYTYRSLIDAAGINLTTLQLVLNIMIKDYTK